MLKPHVDANTDLGMMVTVEAGMMVTVEAAQGVQSLLNIFLLREIL